MSDIFDYNFAFEVDLEKMTGRYVFNTGEIEHIAAEKKILECCDYKYVAKACTLKVKCTPIIYDSSEIFGLTFEGSCLPMTETTTTILATEKGFICQLLPSYWYDLISAGRTISVETLNKDYSIVIINSPFDI